MATFITTKSQLRRHGVAAIERSQPALITATGTGTVVLVDVFDWGPENVLTYPADQTSLVKMLAPAGASHKTSAYLSLTRKSYGRFGFVRVVPSDAVAASCTLNKTGPAAALVLHLKYKGTLGNSVTATVSNASDGNALHFNLVVTLTGPSGTTSDTLTNCSNEVADPAITTLDLSGTTLLGSFTVTANGRPLNGTTSFSAGAAGTLGASDWVGTQGTSDKGIALLEGDKTVDFVVPGDAGSNRAAVNAGAQAHADYMTDRIAVINGPSGQTAAAAQTDVASYRSIRTIYVDPWVYILDEDGIMTLVPPSTFAAGVASQLPPSTSIAWKAQEVRTMLSGIKGVEFARGINAADNTDAGIVTVIKEDAGGFTFESAKNTYQPVDARKGTIKRTRMGHFIARSAIQSLRPYVDSPNVEANQQDEFEAVEEFLSKLKKNAKIDPNHLTHIVDFAMSDPASVNAQSDIDNGEYVIGADVKISSDQEKIFLFLNYGENVNPVSNVNL